MDLYRSRKLKTYFLAFFQLRHYRSIIRAVAVCVRPIDFLRRYAMGSGTYPTAVDLRTPIGPIKLNLYGWHDTRTVNEVFLTEVYKIDASDKIIVDFGSNIGVSAAYFLTRSDDSLLFLFEPVPQNIERLRINLEPLVGRCQLNEIAVGIDDQEFVRFGIEDTGRYGGIGIVTDKFIEVPTRNSNKILADIIEKHGRIDVLKIDVETMEKEIVTHLSPEIAAKVALIYAECFFVTNPLQTTHEMSYQDTISKFVLRD